MRDDSAFLKQLSDDPDDVATPLVYADWLDDHGAGERAAFLRLQQEVLRLGLRQKGLVAMSKRLLNLGSYFDPEWLAVVSRPCLAGTYWSGTSTVDGRNDWHLLPDGALQYGDGPDAVLYSDGSWRQVGNCVLVQMNDRYAEGEVFVAGDRLSGRGWNVAGERWRWNLKRTPVPPERAEAK